MIVATIFKKETKVRLHSPNYSPRVSHDLWAQELIGDHTITVAYGDRIHITLSEDEDKWLITVYGQDRFYNEVTICSMFADFIEKGGY